MLMNSRFVLFSFSFLLLTHDSGGTDICSLFAGMNTSLPVYRGEIQCRMLGMAIEVFTPSGTPCAPGAGQSGELVCTRAFPCQPLGFWPLPGFPDIDAGAVETAQKRHQASYFSEFKDVWCKFLSFFLGYNHSIVAVISEDGRDMIFFSPISTSVFSHMTDCMLPST